MPELQILRVTCASPEMGPAVDIPTGARCKIRSRPVAMSMSGIASPGAPRTTPVLNLTPVTVVPWSGKTREGRRRKEIVVDSQDLKNYGQLNVGKASPRVMMSALSSLPSGLGFIGTPKFIAKLQGKDRHWKKHRFQAVADRGITCQEWIEGISYSIAFYTALVATIGKKKTLEFYPKLASKTGILMDEDFFPSAQDFLRCSDPWGAVKDYFHEYFAVNEREGIMRFEVVENNDSDFQFHVTDCAWHALYHEAGSVEGLSISARTDNEFFPCLAQGIGYDFKRASGICDGDTICDWHFYRHKQDT